MLAVYSRALILNVMCGSEAWNWQKRDESKLKAVKIRSLRRMSGKTMYDSENVKIRKKRKTDVSLMIKIKIRSLRYFRHVVQMHQENSVRRIHYEEYANG